MPKAAETLTIEDMIAELESIVPGFDWVMDAVDDRETIVRETYRDHAPAIALHYLRKAQPALATIGPEGVAPMTALVTANSIDFRD
ncbi:MAG TPA: hypothetical protein VG757_08165 [Devosia sp.]|nr:hypothetical protein [Devosia sp.]